MLKQSWDARNRRGATFSRVIVVAGGGLIALLVAGILMGVGAAGLAWTNTEKFCISCHEMRENAYAEFKDTIHDKNRSGVRAICSDCHVPRAPGPMLLRKVEATFELYGHLIGVIDTKEKFQAHRADMAKTVWTRMKKTDSLECRNCHHEGAMSSEKQTERAQSRHARGKRDGLTCIDCHYGIAHREPDGPGPQEMTVSE